MCETDEVERSGEGEERGSWERERETLCDVFFFFQAEDGIRDSP